MAEAPRRSKARASNQIDHLHDESYGAAFDRRNLDHRTTLHVRGRKARSLDGPWNFTIDPFEEGLRQGWVRDCHLPLEGRSIPWDYDAHTGITHLVPSSWNMQDPNLFHYEGRVWYSRWFDYRAEMADERVFLRLGAANYETKIFLNGRFVGNHLGGSTPVCAELTDFIEERNFLLIGVDNGRRPDRVPMYHIDWFDYGGIHREPALYSLPPVFIRDLFVHLVPDQEFRRIAIEIRLSDAVGGKAKIRIFRLIPEFEISIVDGIGFAVVDAEPELWSPDEPVLYELEAEYEGDIARDRIGFREIRCEGETILLNGEPIFLKGICAHEDDAESGRVTSESDIRRRFGHAKELGCNFMRLAHYPHHERAAEIADEIGLMLWEEIPVYWAIDFANEATLADAGNQLAELILRDRNRPSVVIWGVGNENPDTDARLNFMAALVQIARGLDPSRLISAACLVNKEDARVEDRLAEHLDVIGINEYYGWYDPDFAELEAIGRNYDLGKPLIVTETGADAVAGLRGAEDRLFTEDKMAAVYRGQIRVLSGIKALAGLCPWLLYDFRTMRRQNSLQQGFNRKGLIAADKHTKKAAFDVLRSFYETMT